MRPKILDSEFRYLMGLARDARKGIVSAIAELRMHLAHYDEPEQVIGMLAKALRLEPTRR